MPIFIPVKYLNRKYPEGINPEVAEVAAHFDAKGNILEQEYILHTEYSYSRRKMNKHYLKGLSTIKHAVTHGVPKLWFNKQWAKEFVTFIKRFVGEHKAPRIIEIHPPFTEYCQSIEKFVQICKYFEQKILDVYPKTQIVIENRSGTLFPGTFLISQNKDIEKLAKMIITKELQLRLVLDFPQLFTAHNLTKGSFTKENVKNLVNSLYPIKHEIIGMHIWGKKSGKENRLVSHSGTLDTYFEEEDIKNTFLRAVYELFDDERLRYFVPEVNSKSKDLQAIVQNFKDFGFEFKALKS